MSPRSSPLLRRLALALGALALAGCDLDASLARMVRQRRAEPYETSGFFVDGAAMQVPPEGTVPRAQATRDARPGSEGPITRAVLERGRDRYAVICATCHGSDGRSQTVVADRMKLRRPPSLLEARIRAFAPGRIEQAIEQGAGLMPSFAAELPPEDRRAVAAYVKALQIAGEARLEDLPEPLRAEARAALAREDARGD